MDSRWGHGEVFMHVEEDDRISSLPDDLIHKILSFISLKRAVQTSVLSSRWKYIWTSLPYLNFSSEDFSTLPKFSKFVEHFISGRNNLLQVSSVQLNYCGLFTNEVVRTIMNYTFTHNAQQLSIDCHDNDLPVSLFSSQSLKSLTLYQLEPSPTWDLPCLTTLYLDYVDFDVDKGIGHISKCANLKNLTLSCCSVQSDDDDVTVGCFDIHLPKLCNLTLEDGRSFEMRLNVFASQLENLTVIKWDYEALHLQSIPKLVSLVFQGRYSGLLQISSSFDLCFLERVDLSIYVPFYEEIKDLKDDHNLVALLRQIHNATYITLDLDTVQLISFFGELMLQQPSPFANLKHLKVYPFDPYSSVQQTMPTEVKNYFLDASPGATFTMVSYEEMKAWSYMDDLQELLEQEKSNCLTNRGAAHHIDRSKSPMEDRMSQSWKDLSWQIKQGEDKINSILSDLAKSESSMKELPASKKDDRIHARFSSLRAEAYSVMNLIMDCMKINCDEKQSCISVYLHQLELATSSQPLS